MAIDADQAKLLRQARELSDMTNLPGWKLYKSIIEEHIKLRETIMLSPAHSISPHFDGLDGVTRYGALESIKGAYNGLKLALSLVQSILDEAERIKTSQTDGDDK